MKNTQNRITHNPMKRRGFVYDQKDELKEGEKMNKINEKALAVFNELLEEWYWSEHAVINEYSTNIEKEQNELKIRKKEFQDKFNEAFK